MGESGSGKTTSLRNLNPAETYIIDCDKKGLSWKGWRNQYNAKNRNYKATDDPLIVKELLLKISEKSSSIKNIVIDTLNGVMVADEMRRTKEKGYDKWLDLAQCIWDIVDVAPTLRDDLNVICTAHTQTERDDNGFNFTRIKTSGKKLDKIVLESKFTTVLLSKKVGERYLFETQSKNSTAKSPMGAFDEFEIDNDMVEILKRLEDF